MLQNETLIVYFAKTGQVQQLKLSPQSHTLLLKVFFDKKHSKPRQTNICGRNPLSSPGTHSFLIHPVFKIWD